MPSAEKLSWLLLPFTLHILQEVTKQLCMEEFAGCLQCDPH